MTPLSTLLTKPAIVHLVLFGHYVGRSRHSGRHPHRRNTQGTDPHRRSGPSSAAACAAPGLGTRPAPGNPHNSGIASDQPLAQSQPKSPCACLSPASFWPPDPRIQVFRTLLQLNESLRLRVPAARARAWRPLIDCVSSLPLSTLSVCLTAWTMAPGLYQGCWQVSTTSAEQRIEIVTPRQPLMQRGFGLKSCL
jgi:hypothetical protein